MTNKTENIFEFGPFRLDGRLRRLLRDGQTALDGKPVDLLLALVNRAGEMVTRDELMNEVWGDCCVEEANISRQIWAIRQALGSSACRSEGGGEEYIQTIKSRGYRFLAPVRAVGASVRTASNGHSGYSGGMHPSAQSLIEMCGTGVNGNSSGLGTSQPTECGYNQSSGGVIASGAELRNGNGSGQAYSWRLGPHHPSVGPGMPGGISENLYRSVAPFIGKEADVEAVKALITSESVPLVTLTGAPRVGKTRLALQVASEVSAHFPDGGYFVALAEVTDPSLVSVAVRQLLMGERLPELVPAAQPRRASGGASPSEDLPPSSSAVAAACARSSGGVPCSCGAPMLDSLTYFLGDKRALLVIDNFEHLLPASEILMGLIASCPNLKVLVTSRTKLEVLSGVEYLVKPLRSARLW
jgi:DNA-binding winged helix-turn-helix (wHTH) protein